jgi:hypothetical protein
MYPLCPYQAAWKPGSLVGVAFGGAIPGPKSGAHVAAVTVGATDGKDAATMRIIKRRKRTT